MIKMVIWYSHDRGYLKVKILRKLILLHELVFVTNINWVHLLGKPINFSTNDKYFYHINYNPFFNQKIIMLWKSNLKCRFIDDRENDEMLENF